MFRFSCINSSSLFEYNFFLCRGQPPDYMLKDAKNTSKFFKFVGSINQEECGPGPMSRSSVYQSLTEEEYESVSQ